MLRALQTRKVTRQPFVCWSCLARFHARSGGRQKKGFQPVDSTPSDGRTRISQILQIPKNSHQRDFSVLDRNQAQPHPDNALDSTEPPSDAWNRLEASDIRKKLRIWEAENEDKFIAPPELMDQWSPGQVRNSFTRLTEGEFEVQEDAVPWKLATAQASLDTDERLDVGDRRGFLLPGDLVELLGTGTRAQELAIFVREIGNQAQYYTMSGKWVNRSSKQVKFFVPHFAESTELDDILPYLPSTDVSPNLQDKLHPLAKSAPRNIGKPLVNKMIDFWNQAESAYQEAAFKFDNAHLHVALEDVFRYATLDEIADELIGEAVKKGKDGRYPQPVLYAVHRSLIRNEIGFQCQMRGGHRTGSQYEINSRSEVNNIEMITRIVRQYQEQMIVRRQSPVEGSEPMEPFLERARKLIDRSRKNRQFTPYGTVGPFTEQSQGSSQSVIEQDEEGFTGFDYNFIRFLESWAALRSFSLDSSLNGIGSAILRATQRYTHEGLLLNQTTAWTFLQEIGIIPLWESPAAYFLRIPKVGLRLKSLSLPSETYRKDILNGMRKVWTDTTVYCIDDPNAHEIDDGVSIEKSEIADEYWVHVHTADPSSRLDPEGSLAKAAQARAQTAYLPEMIYSMLPKKYVQAHLSLDKDRPSLTFSARVNTEGHVLETKVTPGTIRNVVFLSPNVLTEVIAGPNPSPPKTVIAIGPEKSATIPSRKMANADELSDSDKENLRLLHMIGEAHAQLRAARGGLSSRQMDNSILVSGSGHNSKPPRRTSAHSYHGDPSIQFIADQGDAAADPSPKVETVQNLMLLGGEIAARWSHERGIPVPFRITPLHPDQPSPGEYFRNTVVPSLDSNGNAPEDITIQYRRLCGQVLTSSTPGPHSTIGLEMYARCTSPLRRYGDLLVHWQVEAALLEEARTGQSLIGNTKDDFLPFTKARMDEILPRLAIAERMLSVGMAMAERTWICKLLLRAWYFEEAGLPPTFEFVVKNVNRLGDSNGHLPFFLENAVCKRPDREIEGDIKVGDVLEVKLNSIDAYEGKIEVKAVRRLNAPDSPTIAE